MPDDKAVRRSNATAPPAPAVEPVPLEWQGSIVYGCPICGQNWEEQEKAAGHIRDVHPDEKQTEEGGE